MTLLELSHNVDGAQRPLAKAMQNGSPRAPTEGLRATWEQGATIKDQQRSAYQDGPASLRSVR